jgi:hypothetical protein
MLRRGPLLPWLLWPAFPAIAAAQAAGTLDVLVQCPSLGTERRAAVEARARTDLLSRGRAVGQLTLTCGQGAAQAEWVSAPGLPPVTSSVAVPDDSHIEDRLLELVARVIELDAAAREEDGASVATFSDSTAPGSAHADALKPGPIPTSTMSSSVLGPAPRESAPRRSGVRWSSSAGGYVEPWFGAAVLAGPRAGLGVVFDPYWLGVASVFGTALSHQSAIAPVVFEPTVEVAIRPIAEFLLATGAGTSWIRLTSSSALKPSSAARWRATAFARAGLLFPTGQSSGLAFAASIQCFDRALEVQANGEPLWSAPACAPRFVVSYESRLPTPNARRRTR